VDFNPKELEFDKCLIAKTNMDLLWHRRLAHVGLKNLHKLWKEGHILGLMNVAFEKDMSCGACQVGKQVGAPHHVKNIMTITRPLEMLHMDLFGPIAYISIDDNKYDQILSWFSNQTIGTWHIHKPNKVHSWLTQEVWHGQG
jgi:hypothetical protein